MPMYQITLPTQMASLLRRRRRRKICVGLGGAGGFQSDQPPPLRDFVVVGCCGHSPASSRASLASLASSQRNTTTRRGMRRRICACRNTRGMAGDSPPTSGSAQVRSNGQGLKKEKEAGGWLLYTRKFKVRPGHERKENNKTTNPRREPGALPIPLGVAPARRDLANDDRDDKEVRWEIQWID